MSYQSLPWNQGKSESKPGDWAESWQGNGSAGLRESSFRSTCQCLRRSALWACSPGRRSWNVVSGWRRCCAGSGSYPARAVVALLSCSEVMLQRAATWLESGGRTVQQTSGHAAAEARFLCQEAVRQCSGVWLCGWLSLQLLESRGRSLRSCPGRGACCSSVDPEVEKVLKPEGTSKEPHPAWAECGFLRQLRHENPTDSRNC